MGARRARRAWAACRFGRRAGGGEAKGPLKALGPPLEALANPGDLGERLDSAARIAERAKARPARKARKTAKTEKT